MGRMVSMDMRGMRVRKGMRTMIKELRVEGVNKVEGVNMLILNIAKEIIKIVGIMIVKGIQLKLKIKQVLNQRKKRKKL